MPGGQVRQAYGRIRLVDVLAAGARRAVGVDAQVRGVDCLGLDFVHLGQHGHGAGRGVDAALRLGGGHTLHAMRARLELQGRIDAAARNAADDLLVAAVFAFPCAQDLDAPAHRFGVPGIHAEQVAGEDGGFVAAGAGADFEIDVALVVRVRRDQRLLQLQLQRVVLFFERGQFFLAQLADPGIAVAGHFPRSGHVRVDGLVVREQSHDRLDPRILPGQVAKLVLVADHLGVGQQPGQFLEAIANRLQLVAYRLLHGGQLTLL